MNSNVIRKINNKEVVSIADFRECTDAKNMQEPTDESIHAFAMELFGLTDDCYDDSMICFETLYA